MRFSSIFSLPLAPPPARSPQPQPQPEAAPEPAWRAAVPLLAEPQQPDDLDQRVRLVGEWQLGEAA